MLTLFQNIFSSFLLGLLTPLTAACVLPLYPAFISYLSYRTKEEKEKINLTGIVATFGIIVFMALVGAIFTLILKISLTKAIGIISPIAFSILLVIGFLLIFNIDISRFIPKPKTPKTKRTLPGSFLFGFFFGAVVIPCNPLFITALFAKTSLDITIFGSILNFIFFGIGMGLPLLVFSFISSAEKVIQFLQNQRRKINVFSGLILIAVSLYYLIFVFKVI